MHYYTTKGFFIFLLLSCSAFAWRQAHAQQQIWRYHPLQEHQAQHFRLASSPSDTLRLPFWDDFSYVRHARVVDADTSLWAAGSRTVRINAGAGIAPPSVGVATFDGVDAFGEPYSLSDANSGLADSLVSRPIDLSVIPPAERDRVFMSFFWQQAGRGEFPDPGDSIRLQFLNAEGRWLTQWQRNGGDSLSAGQFTQEMIQINNPSYFHKAFRFRFQSYNRLSGAFDTWHVDYIYLDRDRSASNTAYLDRALTSLPSSPLGKYTAVPMKQFRQAPERYADTASVGFYNLGALLQPVRFTAKVSDAQTGELLQLLTDDNALSPVPAGFNRRNIFSGPFDPSVISPEVDSLYLQTTFFISSGDSLLPGGINYLRNDTVSSTFSLDEVFAYDDGEAEFGVELNQNGGRLAYRFLASDSSALLTHIDIYFPPLTRNQDRLPFRLIVWETLQDTTGREVELRTQPATVNVGAGQNKFVTYELNSPVVVRDTFYIGYEQQGEVFVVVGFDKNTDTSEEIFFNVNGSWEQDEELSGSMMMRPGFSRNRVITSTLPEVKERKEEIRIYPNPGNGRFFIKGSYQQLLIYDLQGRLLRTYEASHSSEQAISTQLSTGMYLLKILKENGQESRKLIIR